MVQFQEGSGFIAGNGRQVWKEISTVERGPWICAQSSDDLVVMGDFFFFFFFFTVEPVRWENNSIFVFNLK